DDKYKIRKLFVADKNYTMMAYDFRNLEMMLLAHFSEDPKLLKTFEEGHDSHGATAVNVLGLDCHPDEAKKLYPTERNIGKTLNFAQQH
ncbi:MAG: DNA polymerase, partial [bacterium]